MKKDDGFSIIDVSSEEEDEIVIQAGVYPQAAAQIEPESDTSAVSQDAPAADPAVVTASPVDVKHEEYRGVTEEDLDAKVPFNAMRLVIIISAFLFLAAIIVYLVFLR